MNYDDLLEEAGRSYNVDPSLLRLVMTQESAGNPNAVSGKGASGLMQLMPATAREMGVTDLNDPRQNIMGGAKYLAQQLDKYGDVSKALAAYNAGPGAVDRAGGIPNYPETQNYVGKIMGQYQRAPTPPADTGAFRSRFGALMEETPQAPASTPFQKRFGAALQAEQPQEKTPTPPVQPSVTESPSLPEQIGGAGLRVANALGRGLMDVLDAPAEWLAAGAEKSGLTGALSNIGIQMPTYEQQVSLNKQQREGYAQRAGDSSALKTARITGNIGGVMVPISGAESALATGGNALVNAIRGGAPQAANALQGIGRFLSGQGGILSRAAYGGAQGAAGGALLSGGGGDAATEAKLGALLGAPLGVVAPPLINAAAKVVAPLKAALTPTAVVRQSADDIMSRAASVLEQNGGDLSQLPQSVLKSARSEVEQALRAGQELDPAAVARRLEFESIGVQPTLGQLTRNPMQYANERNLRGIESAGESLTTRFVEQNNRLANILNEMGGANAAEADVAGNALMSRLRSIDEPQRQAVGKAYEAARGAEGRYADLDVPAFSKSANDALDESQLGRWLPGQVRGLLNDISSGAVPFNVNTAVQMDSVMSAAQRGASRAGNDAEAKAIGVVRDALNNAPIASAEGETAKATFDQARGAARARFQQIENVPALKAALDDASPDNFVQKYLISADTPSATSLAQYIANDPQAMQTARSQVISYLQSKALGTNTAGDSLFRPEAYNKAIRSLGQNKLLAFFSPEEVAQLNTVGRVAANINSQPAASAVNNSNTAAAAMNLFSKLSGDTMRLPVLNLVRDSYRTFANELGARNALSPVLGEAPERSANELIRLLAPAVESSKPEGRHRSKASR